MIHCRTLAALFIATLVLAITPVFGDGMPIINGRYQGSVTVLPLTAEQRRQLEESRDLKLTRAQKRTLRKETGIGPSTLYIYFTKDGENDCTCFAWNLGLLYSDERIEVPHLYLVSDREARRLQRNSMNSERWEGRGAGLGSRVLIRGIRQPDALLNPKADGSTRD